MEQDSSVLYLLQAGLGQCHAVVRDHGHILLSLFLAGLFGSASHCVGMCSPFVLAQVVARLETVPASGMSELHRMAGAALAPYHFGRATTYAVLGAGAGVVVGSLAGMTWLKWISAALLSFAALVFVGYGLRKLGLLKGGSGDSQGGWWSRQVGDRVGPLLRNPSGWRGYALGVLLGFIPCGLAYGALAAASSTADPLAGAFGMLAFALGTVPALVAVGFAGHVAGRRWGAAASRAAPALMLLNAAILGWMAWTLAA